MVWMCKLFSFRRGYRLVRRVVQLNHMTTFQEHLWSNRYFAPGRRIDTSNLCICPITEY